ncbi:MAG: hypothetical protein OXI87_12845 [Albidovulum sp.]|nr:hypothetical protein [Albidovulum sp.]MDE0305746.1 hypothetical protein [Albidovulum sp.]
MSIERLARSEPDAPARTVFREDEIRVLAVHMSKLNHRGKRGKARRDPTIARFAVDPARLAGFIPTKRRPMPGTKRLREGYMLLSLFVDNFRAMRDYGAP